MSRRPHRATWFAALLLVGGALLAVLGQSGARAGEDVPAPLPTGDADGIVGAEACARCHEQAYALWSASSHAHTFEPVGPDNLPPEVLAEGVASHPPGSTQFRRRGDGWIARTTGPEGAPVDYALTHVVGRMRVRMYVATLPDGRRQVLPGMLEVPTGAWFDYTHLLFGAPGLDWDEPPVVQPGEASFWTGTTRSWDTSCARCHTSGSRPAPGAPVAEGPRLVERRLGVDCEMCHGPGAGHVAWHEARAAGRPTAQATDPLQALGSWPAPQANSVCLQCHMEADLVDRDFQPGDDIFEHVDPTLVIDPERIDPLGRVTELIYGGVPFSLSRCALEGELTCFTCHHPHGSGQASQLRRAADDPAACTSCHEAIGQDIGAHTHHDPLGTGSSCVACHMPFLRIERGHGYIADHSLSIPRPGLELEADRLAVDACTTCHTPGPLGSSGAPPRATAELRAAHAAWWPDAAPPAAWTQAVAAARLGKEGAEAGLLAVLEDATAPRVIRATAMELLGGYATKVPLAVLLRLGDEDSLVRRRAATVMGRLEGEIANRALTRALQDPSRAVRLAAARAALAGWARVRADADLLAAIRPVLRDDAATVPEDSVRWYLLAAAADIANDLPEAIDAYGKMLRIDPFAPALVARKKVLEERLAAEAAGPR